MKIDYCNEADTFTEWLANPHQDWLIPEAIATCNDEQLNALIDRNPAIIQNIRPISEAHLIRATRLLPWAWSVVNRKYVTDNVFKTAQEITLSIFKAHVEKCLSNTRVLVQCPELHEELEVLMQRLQEYPEKLTPFCVNRYLQWQETNDKLTLMYLMLESR